MTNHSRCKWMICVLVGWLITTGVAMGNQITPDQLIRELTQELYQLIDENRANYQQNPDLLKQAVDSRMRQHIDTLYAGRLVLGRHGRGLNNNQIQDFADTLGAVLMNQYAERLLDFDSQNMVEVLALEPNQDVRRTRVKTRLRLDNGSIMPIDYILREDNGDWLVFDVIVEGISYIATFRTQIGDQITQLGFDATLESLRNGQLNLETGQ